MSATGTIQFQQLYGSSFWTNPPLESMDLLINQNQNSTEVLNKLNHFYKDLSELELDYSKRLKMILKKNDVNDMAILNNGGLLQLDGVVAELNKISDVHQDLSIKITDQLYNPGKNLYSERKERGREIEQNLRSTWQELKNLKLKCDKKSAKYKDIWATLTGFKTKMLTMDSVEIQRMNEKIKKMKMEMINIRSENWELVKQYNTKVDQWTELWWSSCLELQRMEESKFKFLKSNIWEFANEIAITCVEKDQIAERIRLSLQSTSLTRELKNFVQNNQTGKELIDKLTFTDYAKGEKEKTTPSRTFQLNQIPSLKAESDLEKAQLEKRKVPPPVLSEVQDTEFEYLTKSKETFKELQEQAQLEIAQNRLRVNTVYSKTDSDPSTYNKVMSEYSNQTGDTSMNSDDHHYSDELSFETDDEAKFNLASSKGKPQNMEFKNEGKLRASMFTTSYMNSKPDNKLEQFDQLVKRNSSKTGSRKVSSSTLLRKSKSQTTFTNLTPENLPSHSNEGFPVTSYSKAQYNYEACISEELSFKKNDILLVLHKQPDGWWFAENYNSGDSGLAPSNYLKDL